VLLAAAEDRCELAIIDLAIREPAGAETVEIVRKMRPRLAVIVLSDDNSVETGRQVLQLSPFYYLLKPLNQEELGQLVELALSGGKRSVHRDR
jgi:DNA-binding NarL/FixJ family response regulator